MLKLVMRKIHLSRLLKLDIKIASKNTEYNKDDIVIYHPDSTNLISINADLEDIIVIPEHNYKKEVIRVGKHIDITIPSINNIESRGLNFEKSSKNFNSGILLYGAQFDAQKLQLPYNFVYTDR